ncbi:MAG: tryptophan synthase subunit alpha [bacterium]|nr:tryptophan synthase subunit alpha [bacterium]
MSRIATTLATLGAQGRAALVPYVTAGDPDLDATGRIVRAMVAAGADLVELGVPFSDPMADGPVLQRSAARALRAGTTLPRVLELVADLRRDLDTPIVLFGYYNPIFRYGVEALARDAARAGADGVLCVDLPPEEAGELRAATRAHALDLIALLAPTTPGARVRRIAREASGFLYFVSVLGVTGARAELPRELPELVSAVRTATPLPVGVGFGVQSPEQAAWVSGFADAVIVGSAIGRLLDESNGDDPAVRIGDFVGGLAAAMRAAGR